MLLYEITSFVYFSFACFFKDLDFLSIRLP